MQLTDIDFQLKTRLFFVTSGLLLLEFCPIKVSCQQREQPRITNINVIWRPSYIVAIPIPRFCYFASPNINNNFHLGLGFTNFHRNTEDLLNLVIQFDESSIFKDYLVHFPAPASKVFLEKKFLMLSQKNFILIFRGMELSSPKTKKFIIFPRKNFSYILGNRTFLKNLFFRREFSEFKK